jgi:hypothetical protein
MKGGFGMWEAFCWGVFGLREKDCSRKNELLKGGLLKGGLLKGK